MDILIGIWIAVLVILIIVAVLFLRGALAVEAATPHGDEGCICKQSRWAVYADINCPVHGERVR